MNAQFFNEHMISGVDPMPATMATPLPLAPLHLAPVGDKAVDLDFDGGRLSSDAGIVLLKDIDDQLGITRALAAVLDHKALNQAAASLYRDRFDSTPGIVYAAGVEHAYNLAQEFRAAGLKAEAVSGKTPPVKLAEILASYERGEIDILINAMLLAEGWNSPRATVVMHLAPTASKRVYQQRIGRIMRTHPRKEAGIVVDFVAKSATHNERVVSLHSLLDADFYREGARVTPAPRRRTQRRPRDREEPPPMGQIPHRPDRARLELRAPFQRCEVELEKLFDRLADQRFARRAAQLQKRTLVDRQNIAALIHRNQGLVQ